jgi:hypothetical protein
MESRVVVTALILTIIGACTKHEIEIPSSHQTLEIQEKEVRPSAFFSEWETVSSWNSQVTNNTIVFSYSRQFPGLNKEVLANGAVLVFARNLWADDLSLKEFGFEANKPLLMPFYFLPYFEKPDYTEQWNYTTEKNSVKVSLTTKGASQAAMPGKKIQLRFVILPAELLKQKGQTIQGVRKLSYDKLVQTFGMTS